MISSSSNPRPARKGSLKPAQITGYLAGAVGTAALFSAPQAEAAVTAITFGFGPELTHSSGYTTFSAGSYGSLYAAGVWWGTLIGAPSGQGKGTAYHNSVVSSNYGPDKNGTRLRPFIVDFECSGGPPKAPFIASIDNPTLVQRRAVQRVQFAWHFKPVFSLTSPARC